MRMWVGAAVGTAMVAAVVLTSCSGGSDPAAVDGGPTSIPVTVPTLPAPAGGEPAGSGGTEDAPDAAEPTAAPTFTVVSVPESGVPGLDSDDAFCAAWSRFGGTWQVLQVAANFAPDPTVVPALEIVAAPVVATAYDELFAAWPDELAAERDVVADGFFGPLDRRAQAALDALASAGATDADLDTLAVAWEDALATRRVDDPVVTPVLDDDRRALVVAAAADFDARLAGFVDDPSMRITAETPRTDAFLATACPDQGSLTGGEIDG